MLRFVTVPQFSGESAYTVWFVGIWGLRGVCVSAGMHGISADTLNSGKSPEPILGVGFFIAKSQKI
jgi:hypothetical protein